MRILKGAYILMVLAVLSVNILCRKVYEPPEIKASNHFLAIDGFINTGTSASSVFTLSRSLSLTDSLTNLPELNAEVIITGANGSSYRLTDSNSTGVYVSDLLNLDPSQQYHLTVTTQEGNKYQSDPVTPKYAPGIDSLNWEQVSDPVALEDVVNVYVNAHDSTNKTRYYRWDYDETFQHQSYYQSFWFVDDQNRIRSIAGDSTLLSTHVCWTTQHSTSILLGTSITLSQDVISQVKIAEFKQNDPRLDIRYSMNLRQYPIDLETYQYWLTVQKNSQSLGGLFDLQPSQIKGNIHGVTNPTDPVLGYVSASSVTEKRIYIDNHSLTSWKSNIANYCPTKIIGTDPLNTLVWNYPDTAYTAWFFTGGPPPDLIIAFKSCIDCRYQGGTNQEPNYWIRYH
jgi:hypothetical protein